MDCYNIKGEQKKEINPIREGSYPARKAGLKSIARQFSQFIYSILNKN